MTKFFRVDRRVFTSGCEILPKGDYQSRFDDAGTKAEEILERVRSEKFGSKPNRADMLFISDDLKCAEQYWRTHDKTSVYEVELDEGSIAHRGDMNWVDIMGAELRKAPMAEPDAAKLAEYAEHYWRGDETDNPCLELLVPKATAISRTHELSDLKAYIAKHVTKNQSRTCLTKKAMNSS